MSEVVVPPPAAPRILVADDDDNLRELLVEILTTYGAKVTAAVDGQAAVTQAMMQPFDAVILDIEMPNLDGIQACRQLRTLAFTREVPVLILTGRTDKESIDKSFAAGAWDFLNKPVHAVLLWRRVCNMLELKKIKDSRENMTTLMGFVENSALSEVLISSSAPPFIDTHK